MEMNRENWTRERIKRKEKSDVRSSSQPIVRNLYERKKKELFDRHTTRFSQQNWRKIESNRRK